MRVEADNVSAILDNTELTDAQIDVYITSANIMVTQILGTTLDDDVLAEIERWLAGHMIAITRERQALEEKAGGAEIIYTGKYGMALSSTSYGQMVLALDTTGEMAKANQSLKTASIYAVTSFD